ncbi:MAG: hypothetical protein HY912_08030 [Desulfomonile tiedjei]|uniref:Uncharacterized protein n=1 Tax=Desulfomonile tiedjei TaxID=2358 RepID=A0A9D6V018_9BACT|nr:hypothetical protein [Desulfomonile tiedjei]
MIDWSIADVLITILLTMLVPSVVNHYLKAAVFTTGFRRNVILIGIAWLAYAWISENYVYYLLGLTRADAGVHWQRALDMSSDLARGHSPFGTSFPLSNDAYVAYLAYLHYLTGATSIGAVVINAFLGFIGGLTLARVFVSGFIHVRGIEKWLYLVIFFPSTVFWTTSNMKEGLMYWSVCQILSFMPAISRNEIRPVRLSSIAGVVVAGILRPHVCAAWLMSCGAVELLQRGKRLMVVALLAVAIPITLGGLERLTGANVTSPELVVQRLSERATGLSDPSQGSYIDYGPEGSVFFVSGITAVFFRPFPWEIRSTRVLISSLETWLLTILICVGWFKAGSVQRKWLVRMPTVRASVLAILAFSVIFSFLPNEGLLVRQRIQVVPALLALAFFPFITANYLRYREWLQWDRIAREEERFRGQHSWR